MITIIVPKNRRRFQKAEDENEEDEEVDDSDWFVDNFLSASNSEGRTGRYEKSSSLPENPILLLR